MKFSYNGDSLLKRVLKAESKEDEIRQLSLSITKLENGLKKSFSSQYSEMIADCSSLDELRETIMQVQAANMKMRSAMEEIQMEKGIAQKEMASLETALERIQIVQREISSVEEFLSKSFEAQSCLSSPSLDKIEGIYSLVRNVVDIQKSIQGFRKYYFHLSFETILENLRLRLKRLVFGAVDRFLQSDFAKVGRDFRICKEFRIFDEFKCIRRELLSLEFRDALFCAKYLGLTEEVVDYMNARRSRALRAHGIDVPDHGVPSAGTDVPEDNLTDQSDIDGDRTVQFCIGNVLASFVLSLKLPQINTFYEDIFNGLKSCTVENVLYVTRLRGVASGLKIQSSALDDIVESAVFQHFDRQFADTAFEADVEAFIVDGIDFLDEANEFANEFDEMLVRRIDDALIDYMNRGTFKDMFERQSIAERIMGLTRAKRPFFKSYSFAAEREIEMASSRQLERMVREFKEFLDEERSMEQIVERVISLKEIPSAEFRRKLAERLTGKAEDLIPNRSKDDTSLFVDIVRRNLL